MATSAIDLSGGLVAKPIDLSSGLVPKAEPPAEKSLFQRAKDNFNAATQGAKPGDGVIKGAVENFGAGGADQLRALAHPIQTLEGIGNAVMHPVDTVKSVADYAVHNPARFAGGAGVGLLFGEAAGAATEAANGAVSGAAGRAALLGKTPSEAYESALKPPVTTPSAIKVSAVKAGLENEVPISSAGVEKVADRIDELNQAIKDHIDSDPTRPIDPNKVASRADQAKVRFSKQVNAGGDLKAIEDSKTQFLAEQGASTPKVGPQGPAPVMNAADAQAMKQGTYRVLSGKFGEQGSAAVEAQKALARGLKEEIADKFPEIAGLNSQESKLLDLQPLLDRAVNRATNQGIFRLGTGLVAGTAKAFGASNKLAAVAAVMKQVLDDPMIKSRLAISVSKGAKIPYAEGVARVAAYSSALGSTADASQAYSSGDNPDLSTNGQH